MKIFECCKLKTIFNKISRIVVIQILASKMRLNKLFLLVRSIL